MIIGYNILTTKSTCEIMRRNQYKGDKQKQFITG